MTPIERAATELCALAIARYCNLPADVRARAGDALGIVASEPIVSDERERALCVLAEILFEEVSVVTRRD